MTLYSKIETLFDRDEATHKVLPGKFRLPVFEYLKDNAWVWTEKVDGTNVRVMWDGERVTLGGKTDNAQLHAKLVERLQLFTPDHFRQTFDADAKVCLYGEGYGSKIQKGGGNYKADGVDFVMFDVRVSEWWLERDNVVDVAKKMGGSVVPIVGEGTLREAAAYALSGPMSEWGSFPMEGLVVRPKVELRLRNGDRIIGKIKAKDFPKPGDSTAPGAQQGS